MKNFKIGDIVFDNLLCKSGYHFYQINELTDNYISANRIAIRRSFNLDIYLRVEDLGIEGSFEKYRFCKRLSLANHRELRIINKLLTFQ